MDGDNDQREEPSDMGMLLGNANVSGIGTARRHFASFLSVMNDIDPAKYPHRAYDKNSIPVDFFTPELIGRFGTYLMEEVKVKKLYAFHSYISKTKKFLTMDYRGIGMTMFDGEQEW
jgi:hypothetical protein